MTDAALPTFIAESRELLREMEAALLECEQGETGAEAVNSIFRAAHTIKGSSGLFGLDGIVAFTHVVESVLDRVRANSLQMDRTLAAILLECRDHIEHLVDAVADGKSGDVQLATKGESLLHKLSARAGGSGSAASHASVAAAVAPAAGSTEPWQITVQFHAETIDRSFVRGAPERESLQVILRSAIDMANRLGLVTVAEGVETLQEWRMLQEFGCTLGQGWLIARPMAGDDVIGWMKQYRAHAAQLRA